MKTDYATVVSLYSKLKLYNDLKILFKSYGNDHFQFKHIQI